MSVANKFVGDGVKFVVGHFNSGVTIPASDVYSENGILFITPSATNPKVTDRKLWDAFRTCGRDDQQGMVWAELARDKLKGKKIAVIHDKTTYGKGLADAALDNMHKFGVKEVLYEGVNTGEKDYSAIVSKIKEADADYLMWGGLHTEGGLILRQMRDQGMSTVMISGDGITDSEFAAIGGPGVEGTLMTFGPEPRNNPNAKDAVASFKAKGFDPQGYTLYSYAAVQIIKQAAEKANSLDPKKVAEVMHSGIPFHTVIGDISYDKKGDRTTVDYVWYVWKKGPTARSGSCSSERGLGSPLGSKAGGEPWVRVERRGKGRRGRIRRPRSTLLARSARRYSARALPVLSCFHPNHNGPKASPAPSDLTSPAASRSRIVGLLIQSMTFPDLPPCSARRRDQ